MATPALRLRAAETQWLWQRTSLDRGLRVRPYRLEVGEHRLLRDGQPLPLPAKIFDTLVELVAAPARW
jgi:DNA-binding response OmpR family regulator